MKKVLLSLLLLLMPLNLVAYSNKIALGGETIGIEIETKGLIVVGFYKINGQYMAKDNLQIGDIIIEINGKEVNKIEDITRVLENTNTNELNLLINRNNKEHKTTLKIFKEEGIYKTGIYVKDTVLGIGTMTYIDPKTKIYGSLGHQVEAEESTSALKINEGNLLNATIETIEKSENGIVGNKNARVELYNQIGSINKNTNKGIYGIYNNDTSKRQELEIMEFDDIKKGKAFMYTQIDNNVEKYEIEITSKNKDLIKTNKSISFKITDKKLLERAGGIIRGMSGSPIVQDNKIIGAVTHVVVDDVEKGYAIYIKTMLEEGEKD